MLLRKLKLGIVLICLGFPAIAEDRLVRLEVPQTLIDSGLIKHMLPRFSLKTQVRVELVQEGAPADMRFGSTGTAIFTGPQKTWYMAIENVDHAGTQKLAAWLTSDIGMRTVTGFAPDGTALFSSPQPADVVEITYDYDGDAEEGRRVSMTMCGRCHVVDPDHRMNGIGSTPSFFVLRSLENWDERFESFYALNPHPAFTQIAEVTPPFPHNRPPPIVPIQMTLEDLEAILSYVALLDAADLGAPLQHQ